MTPSRTCQSSRHHLPHRLRRPQRLAVNRRRPVAQPARHLERVRVLELVQGFVEDQAQQALFLAERVERMTVVVEQLVAVLPDQAGPAVLLRHDAGQVVRCLGPFVGHLEEQ